MGLFNFFKSNEKKQINQQIEDLNRNIFPGGKDEIDKAVKAVREITEYRYSYDETFKTYVNLSISYFLSKDKDIESIARKILTDEETVFSKSDVLFTINIIAEIFKIKNKNNPKIIFEEQSIASKIFMIALGGIVELKKYKDLTNEGKFEVLIFNSIIVLNEFGQKYPDKYENMVDEVCEKLFDKAKNLEIKKNRSELEYFVNERFITYTNELNQISSQNKYFIPSKSFSYFYKAPLSFNNNIDVDLISTIEFYKYLINMINWVEKGTKNI